MTGPFAPALRVLRVIHPAIAVQIQPRHHTSVHRSGIAVRINQSLLRENLLQTGKGAQLRIPVHLRQQDDIGRDLPQDRRDLKDRLVTAFHIPDQMPGIIAGQGHIVGRQAQRLRLCCGRQRQEQREGDPQAQSVRARSISHAIFSIALPRLNRATGKNAQKTQHQTRDW